MFFIMLQTEVKENLQPSPTKHSATLKEMKGNQVREHWTIFFPFTTDLSLRRIQGRARG